MALRIFKLIVIIVVMVFGSGLRPTFAMGIYLQNWNDRYPATQTSQALCQMCHQDSEGGDGWNAYGWRLRNEIVLLNRPFDTALTNAEGLNSDLDSTNTLSITEIELGTQPGWTAGKQNSIFYKNGTTLTGLLPPFDLPNSVIVDPPSPIMDSTSENITLDSINLVLQTVVNGFNLPIVATRAEGINDIMFVAEQGGKIWAVDLLLGEKKLFHDLGSTLSVLDDVDDRGLLGLAFHPDFLQNGLFYTHQSEPVGSNIADFSTMPESIRADHHGVVSQRILLSNPANIFSELLSFGDPETLLRVDQPQANHNGGNIAFGPDGYLYISFGDGGNEEDEEVGHGRLGNGRNNENPLGAILRIDPFGSNSDNGNYGIPGDNPFVGEAGLNEIYAYGFKNVTQFSFDSMNGDMYAADEGQYNIEEVNIVQRGGNYGWNWKEGAYFFYPNGPNSGYISNESIRGAPDDLLDPVAQYDHEEGSSIVGGVVYRGSMLKALTGKYIFADANNRFLVMDESDSLTEMNTSESASNLIRGLAQDNKGELYVIGVNTNLPRVSSGYLKRILRTEASEQCFPIIATTGMAVICL